MILGGVGLGVCSACRAPGAFWCQSDIPGWPGVWMCDSCSWPDVVHARIRADIIAQRNRCPHGLRGAIYCPDCDRCICPTCTKPPDAVT